MVVALATPILKNGYFPPFFFSKRMQRYTVLLRSPLHSLTARRDAQKLPLNDLNRHGDKDFRCGKLLQQPWSGPRLAARIRIASRGSAIQAIAAM